MIKAKRHAQIPVILAHAGEELSIPDIARRLGRISLVTVRRDVAHLAECGVIDRTHGGAAPVARDRARAAPAQETPPRDAIEDVDAIVLPPIGGRGADTLRMLARRRGLLFLAESSPQEGGVYLGPDNVTAGRDLGRAAGRILAGRLTAARILLVALDELPNTRARCDGFLKGFAEAFPAPATHWRVEGQGRFSVALRASLDAFAAHPDINVVFGVNDHSILAAIEAADRLGIAEIAGFSVGGEGGALFDALAAGRRLLACAALFPEIVGIRAMEALAAALRGGTMPSAVPTPYAIISRDTLDRYYRRDAEGWSLAPEAETAILGPSAAGAKVIPLPDRRRVIGFVPHYPAHDWYRNMARAMRARAERLGLELRIAAPQAGIAREILALRRMIAAAAARLIRPGETVLINAGVISLLLAEEIGALSGITVVTNAIEIAERLTDRPGLKVILTSGEYQRRDRCLVGPSLGALFETLRVDRAFLSVDGISARFGPSASDERLALAARRFVEASRGVVVMADHSLVGIEASHRIVSPRRIDDLITDSGSLPADRLGFASAGMRVTLADEETEQEAPMTVRSGRQ